MSDSAHTTLPRWRGFNLLDFFTTTSGGGVSEDDFRWISDWGFDSHYRASWVNSEGWPEPTWPGEHGGKRWDRTTLEKHYGPWLELARQGVGVHCGEGGAFSFSPHRVFLSWYRDVLEILTGGGIGYALWNFRGAFGVLDSDRRDVDYEDWRGHQLDRKLLSLMQEY